MIRLVVACSIRLERVSSFTARERISAPTIPANAAIASSYLRDGVILRHQLGQEFETVLQLFGEYITNARGAVGRYRAQGRDDTALTRASRCSRER